MFVDTLVLLFLLLFRFPRNRSVADVITERYGRPVLNLYRTTERHDYKVRKIKSDLHFLNCCRSQDLTPNFLQFRLANRNLLHSRAYRTCQKQFLQHEIRSKNRALNTAQRQLNDLLEQLKSAVSFFDFLYLNNLIITSNANSVSRVDYVHQRKLCKLGYVNDCNMSPDTVIFNYSSVQLSDLEKSALSKGLKFVFPPKKLNYIYHMLPFEKLVNTLSNLDFYDPLAKGFNYFKQSLGYLANWSFYSFNPFSNKHLFDKDMFTALKSLSKKENLIITRPDKGNGVVLLNKDSYLEKMTTILNDASKFSQVTSDVFAFLLKMEDKVNRLLRKFRANNIISDSTFYNLYCSGSRPGVMYGLPKVHKEGCPIRPILAAIGTHNYNLAKFLVPILDPISVSEYTVKDSFSFAKELSDLSFPNGVMASFDVQSLFTNIPLAETIEICISDLFQDDERVQGFTRKEMKDLLTLAANDCIFTFNEKFYVQIDGCAMGSPVGPSFANIFLSHYEKLWLQDCPQDFKPLFYRRYVDDTFLVFREQSHVLLFLNYLNNKHPNIKFTSETEKDHSIAFLDIAIMNTECGFKTNVYRKPTFTGLSTKFSSFIPLKYKRNLVTTLAYRAFNICSNYDNLHRELNYLRNFLFNNGFPRNFLDVWIGKTLNKLLNPPKKHVTVERRTIYFSIPYMGPHSFQIKNKLNRLLNAFYPQVSLKTVFTPSMYMGNLFKFKDKISDDLRSCIVYLYKCDSCNASYVGKSERHFRTRIANHEGRSERTGCYLVKPQHSAIREHCETQQHRMSKKNFSILGSTSEKLDLKIMEALFQHQKRPTLGRPSYELSCV